MLPRVFSLLSAVVFFVAAAPAPAQSSAPQVQPAQAASAGNPAQPAQPSSPKVWTNEDLKASRDDGPVLNPAGPNTKAFRPTQKAAPNVRQNAVWYRTQIAKLQEKTPPLDAQIAGLQDAIDGKPTGDGKKSTRHFGVRQADWPAQLDELRNKREKIQGQISELRDQARHAGIPASQIP